MVDTFRGQIRVRKWPRKRGPPKSQVTRDQNTWFKQANDIAKRLEPTQMNLAIEMTKGTGLYPRDLLLRQQAGGIYDVFFEDGSNPQHRRYFRDTIMFQGCILHNTVAQVLNVGAWRTLAWQLPVLDTAGFWNAGAPNQLTIPAGIEVIALAANLGASGAGAEANMRIAIFLNATEVANLKTRITGFLRHSCSVAAVPVILGDVVTVQVFLDQARTSVANSSTSLTLVVLQAT